MNRYITVAQSDKYKLQQRIDRRRGDKFTVTSALIRADNGSQVMEAYSIQLSAEEVDQVAHSHIERAVEHHGLERVQYRDHWGRLFSWVNGGWVFVTVDLNDRVAVQS
jgi:hypothetical protein